MYNLYIVLFMPAIFALESNVKEKILNLYLSIRLGCFCEKYLLSFGFEDVINLIYILDMIELKFFLWLFV